ncbi:MAG: galactokinase [Nocardioidaceae bacterium]
MTSTWVAPGRVNLIGEHVDYNDGLVLPFALPLTTQAQVRATNSDRVNVSSSGADGVVWFDVGTEPGDVAGWAAYVAGVLWALGTVDEHGPSRLPCGLDIEITGDLPNGAGLASSAALTCAVACATNDELGLGLSTTELASAARRAENDYVGVPTGVMDQLASLMCEPQHALLLDCRSMQSRQIAFDPPAAGLCLLVVDTMARHALVDGAYAERRADCRRAAEALGVPSLRDASLEQVAELSDPLRRRAHHVVSEIRRVTEVAALLDASHQADIGSFLTASHESLRDDFEVSCDELDTVVQGAVSAGALGARMTGAGFGGCAVVLCRNHDVAGVLERLFSDYEHRGWPIPGVWTAAPERGAHRVG